MIRAIAQRRGTDAGPLVSGVARREGAQAHRRPQRFFDGVDDASCPLSRQESDAEPADCENLVGSKEVVRPTGDVIDVDDVVETAARRIPEARPEALDRFVRDVAPPLAPAGAEHQSVHPECLHLYRLANAGRHGHAVDDGIHPGQRDSRLAGGQQAVAVHVNVEARAARIRLEDLLRNVGEAPGYARLEPPAPARARVDEGLRDQHVPERRIYRVVRGLAA